MQCTIFNPDGALDAQVIEALSSVSSVLSFDQSNDFLRKLPLDDPRRARGIRRSHKKTSNVKGTVIHEWEYVYPQTIPVGDFPPRTIKILSTEVSVVSGVKPVTSQNMRIVETSKNSIAFAILAFGLAEDKILRSIRLFDSHMVRYGWTNLDVHIINIDDSAEKAVFHMYNNEARGGRSHQINEKFRRSM